MSITLEEAKALGYGQHFAIGTDLRVVYREGWFVVSKYIHRVELGDEVWLTPYPFSRLRVYWSWRFIQFSIGRYILNLYLL